MANKSLNQLLTAVTVVIDFCLIGISIRTAYWLRFESGWLQAVAIHTGGNPPLAFYFQLIPLNAAIWILTLRGLGLYRVENEITLETGLTLLKASAVALISTLGAVFFFYHHHEFSRWVMLLACGTSAVFLYLNRLAVQRFKQTLQQAGIGVSQVAVVGFNATTRQLIHSIRGKARKSYQLLGVIIGKQLPPVPISQYVLGGTTEVRSLVQKYQINELFITSPAISHEEILQIVHDCEGLPVQIRVLPDLYEVMIGKTHVVDFDGIPVVQLKELPLHGWCGLIKRGLDIALSTFALVILSPVMVAIAIAVKLTSAGSVIFRQERISRDGTAFRIYKFRSMRQDAEAGIGHTWAAPDDPRQTRLGRFLRRWGLDELPQLVNVVKGDMSLVGPRPEMSGLIDDFSKSFPHYLDRHRVKCGLTGWAQVNGLRGNTSLEERLRYDLFYIENWSLGFDIKILLKTLWAIKKSGSPQK